MAWCPGWPRRGWYAVSPLEVVKDGNRNMHGVIRGVKYADPDGSLAIDSLDAFMVAPGDRLLLDYNNRQPDMRHGVHFNLLNDLFGTNFAMWFEGDMLFRFVLRT